MPRFKPGDRVQLIGDISRFYKCVIGVVLDCGGSASSILKTYLVRLADNTVDLFFDFQLQTPPLGSFRPLPCERSRIYPLTQQSCLGCFAFVGATHDNHDDENQDHLDHAE
jgi:hypothetical protein